MRTARCVTATVGAVESSGGRLGDRINSALLARGTKRATLAALLEVSPSTVTRWINGVIVPKPTKLEAMKQILGADLLLDEEQPAPSLFVASPITALPEDQRLAAHQDLARLVAAMRRVIPDVRWPGEHGVRHHRGVAEIATQPTMTALYGGDALVYVQLTNVTRATGALVELGIALGLQRPITLILGTNVARPFMFEQGFEAVAARLHWLPDVRVVTVTSAVEAEQIIHTAGARLFMPAPPGT
jgi:transcriptional regulator with XRE-family HTH domain